MSEIDLEQLADAYERGLAHERAGDVEAAVAAYQQALALDPEDRGGVSIRLAALGRGQTPRTAPPAYVATLFDQTAPRFDEILVDQLGYAVPLMVRETLEAQGLRPGPRMLDLGCGTGLAGIALADLVEEITGVDLSEEMLAEADERDCYDGLFVGDATAFLAAQDPSDAPYDLIVATDMLPYMGALEELFAGLTRCLAPGGLVAVSTEALAPGHGDYRVGPGHRFAHGEDYLRRCFTATGLTLRSIAPIVVRYNDGTPVPGHLAIGQAPGAAP
ncbi:MAG: methyltransferase domain-containing protein [Pikeienuella sp.]